MRKNNFIETERLLLKPTTLDDAKFILELLNTPKWKQFIGDRKVYTIADAEDYIKVRMLPQLERLGFGNYIVNRKEDNVKVGSCGLYDRDGLDGIDLGFAFLPAFENKGYAFESNAALVEAAKTEFKLKILLAITAVDNVNSQKLLLKLGFKYEKLVIEKESNEQLMLYNLKII